MKKTVYLSDFVREFEEVGRGDQFSSAALGALYDYLERLEEDTGEETELDVIAICCEWTEYNGEELLDDYGYLLDAGEIEDMDEEEVTEYLVGLLQERTTVLEVENGNFLVMTEFGC